MTMIKRLLSGIIKFFKLPKIISSLLRLQFFDRNFIPTIKIKKKFSFVYHLKTFPSCGSSWKRMHLFNIKQFLELSLRIFPSSVIHNQHLYVIIWYVFSSLRFKVGPGTHLIRLAETRGLSFLSFARLPLAFVPAFFRPLCRSHSNRALPACLWPKG